MIEFVHSKKLGHEDGMSRLIPRFSKTRGHTVINNLRAEKELKDELYNTVRELPVTSDKIKIKDEKILFHYKNKK